MSNTGPRTMAVSMRFFSSRLNRFHLKADTFFDTHSGRLVCLRYHHPYGITVIDLFHGSYG